MVDFLKIEDFVDTRAGKVGFSANLVNARAALNKLIDLAEAGHILIQDVKMEQVAKPDDYLVKTVTLQYFEKSDKPDPVGEPLKKGG